MRAWFRQNHGKLQFGLRMTLAALASYGLGEALGLAQNYWAVLSAVIVIQGSVGGSLRAGINRFVGTVGGAIWGAVVALTVPHNEPAIIAVALLLALAPLSILTAFRPAYRVAPITAIIVLMGASFQKAEPISSALSRVVEISLGSAVAIAVALFILPASAHRLLATAASNVVAAMAEIMSLFEAAAGGSVNALALLAIQSRLRAGLAQTETHTDEAKVELMNRLSEGPDPEPLARTLQRLRHDLAMVARAIRTPFSELVRSRFNAPLTTLYATLASWFIATSKALAAREQPPDLDGVRTAVEEYKTAVALCGQDGLGYEAENDDTQRVYALLFLFEQMLPNLQDLADRTKELSATTQALNESGGA
jgi:uncharacterized membrane protein YccC